ncbi:AAA family ATPase [Candidatus Dojkabacteria bacterium]|nr:AAA family ATPase [Candidatus Dojkabacteria bacterium]
MHKMSENNKFQKLIKSLKSERDYLLGKQYVYREKSQELNKALDTELIKVITGPRRSGKSTLALQALSETEDFFYLNFDNTELLGIEDIFDFVTSESKNFKDGNLVFLDEVQNVENFELLLTRLQRNGYNLVITGSNSKLLSRELATSLTGRYRQIEVMPFSFTEAKRLDNELSYIEYLRIGGFPEQIKNKGLIEDYLTNLLESVVLKDIVWRYNIRNTPDLNKLSNYLMRTPSQLSSFNKIKDKLGLASVNTVIDYYSYLEEAYLVNRLHYFSYKNSEVIKSNFKSYLIDTGVFLDNPLMFKGNTGYLFENAIFVDLVRKGYKPQQTLFQLKNNNGTEVDFLLRDGSKNVLIQTSLSIKDNETKLREFKGLNSTNFENSEKYVVVANDDEGNLGEGDVEILSPEELQKVLLK